jgi:hypothetical protein
MPITLNCACGKTLRVPDTSAGKRAKCPACGALVAIPVPAPPPEPEPEPVFEIEEPAPVGPSPSYKKPFVDDDDEAPGTYGLATPEEPPSGGGGKSGGSGGGGGSASGPKKLPNFRIGTDNHK